MKKLGVVVVLIATCLLGSCVTPEVSVDNIVESITTTTSISTTLAGTMPTSDYTGVALNMPESVSEIYESYDHTAWRKVLPYNANTIRILSSGTDLPIYVEISEERIKELNGLYESITEFKDYSGELGAEPTIVIKCDGETYRLGRGCATQRALNLYIDKLFACDASDEEWRAIDEMTYYSEADE